ncbi:hypothetical protein Xenpb_03819 [Xenorhabdus sp. PB62.4]|nr:hypothetical protein [Xenorhabdus sp. PB62.4]
MRQPIVEGEISHILEMADIRIYPEVFRDQRFCIRFSNLFRQNIK